MKRIREKDDKDVNPPKRSKIDKKFNEIRKFQNNLPIFSCRARILDYFRNNQVLMVVGETGCGKTTQIPQYIYNSWNEDERKLKPPNIVITQPRRLAATEIAKRVNYEIFGPNAGHQLGDVVGYKVRFKSRVKPNTKLSFLTDGMLIREFQEDKDLLKYDVIIIDEAHERTLHTEILLGIVKKLLGVRSSSHPKPLKLVIMSATLEVEKFSKFFSAPVLIVDGRLHPISVYYTPKPIESSHDGIINAVLQIHLDGVKDYVKGSDILVFSTGSQEIEQLALSLEKKAKGLPRNADKLIVCKLYAALPERIKNECFKKVDRGCRKVILATNIAETSLTIPGVKYVIDSGLVKTNRYDPKLRQDVLTVEKVSKAQATQRAGRAGREQPGFCYRLYEEDDFRTMNPFPIPEIRRSNLSSVILQMLSMGIQDLHNFSFLDPPNNLDTSLDNLELLGAIEYVENSSGKMVYNLTPLGEFMAILPLDPLYSITLLRSVTHGCTIEVLAILSILIIDSDEGGVFYFPMREQEEAGHRKMAFASPIGDHFTLLNVFCKYLEKKAGPYTSPQTVKHIPLRRRKEKELQDFCNSNFLSHKKMKKACSVLGQLADYCGQISVFEDVEYFMNNKQKKSNNNNNNNVIREEISGIEAEVLKKYSQEIFSPEKIQNCFLEGFWMNTAMQTEKLGKYKTFITNQEVFLHPATSLKKDWSNIECIMFCNIVKTTKEYVRNVMKVDRRDLTAVMKKYGYEEKIRRIEGRSKRRQKNFFEEEEEEEEEEELEGEDDAIESPKVIHGPQRPPHMQMKSVEEKRTAEEEIVHSDTTTIIVPPPPPHLDVVSSDSSLEMKVEEEEEEQGIVTTESDSSTGREEEEETLSLLKKKQPKKKRTRRKKKKKKKKDSQTSTTTATTTTKTVETPKIPLNRKKKENILNRRRRKMTSHVRLSPPTPEKPETLAQPVQETRTPFQSKKKTKKVLRKYGGKKKKKKQNSPNNNNNNKKKNTIKKKYGPVVPKDFFKLSSSQSSNNNNIVPPPPPSSFTSGRVSKDRKKTQQQKKNGSGGGGTGKKKKKKRRRARNKKKKKNGEGRNSASPKTPVDRNSFVFEVIKKESEGGGYHLANM